MNTHTASPEDVTKHMQRIGRRGAAVRRSKAKFRRQLKAHQITLAEAFSHPSAQSMTLIDLVGYAWSTSQYTSSRQPEPAHANAFRLLRGLDIVPWTKVRALSHQRRQAVLAHLSRTSTNGNLRLTR